MTERKEGYVLISFIGRNKDGYDTVDYLLPENEEKIRTNDTSIALIRSEKQHWHIIRAVIIGTYTSSWAELVPEDGSEDLRHRLEVLCKEGNEESLDDLVEALKELSLCYSERFGVDMIPLVHRSDVTEETISDIATDYDTNIIDLINGYSNVLIDITHGFRHMPILLFQIFQQHMLELGDVNVELVYGEYNKDTRISRFRNLQQYWEITKLTDAINRFRTSCDGSELAPYVRAAGLPKIANWITRFSMIISSDYLMQIYSLARSLPKYMEAFFELETIPAWLNQVKQMLEDIQERISCFSEPYDIYYAFAECLDGKGLLTHATIALAAAIETRVAVTYARLDSSCGDDYAYVGNYNWWTHYSDDPQNKSFRVWFSKQLPNDTADLFSAFYEKRNMIAHAAGSRWKEEPAMTIFSLAKYLRMAKDIFAMMDAEEAGVN